MDGVSEITANPNKSMLWDPFLEKDYEGAAKAAAKILKDCWALDAIHVAGLSLCGLDRMEEGFDWLCASLSLAAAKPDWYANAAIAMMDKKDYIRAMLFVQNGIKDFPDDIRLSYMRGLCMCHAQGWQQAIEFLDDTIRVDSTFYHSYVSKGFCLHMLGRYDEAVECYKLVKQEDATEGDFEETINNWACVLLEQGKPKESLDLLNKYYPDSKRPGTIYNKSFIYMGLGDWPKGWHMYRQRQTVQVKGDQGVPLVEHPLAKDLEDIKGKDLFLFHEQGLGDTLQFVRYAKILYPMVKSMTIAVPKPLHRIMEHFDLPEPFTVVSDGEKEQDLFSHCEVAMPMLDAPSMLETNVNNIPNFVPYFKVPQTMIDKHQLMDTCKPLVGLVWAGASRPDNIRANSIDKRRSIPFDVIDPILQLHHQFQFISLQLPDHRVDDDRLIQPLRDGYDILDTAAVISQLDLVITIDSSLAHLAGAINKPVWMLTRYDQCWRWFWDGRTTTPWYPTMELFQQKSHGAWTEVIERVVQQLKQRHFT